MTALSAAAQGGFQPPTAESEVTRRFSQVEALLADGLWDEAIDLIEATQVEHGRLLIELASDRFAPVAFKCQQLLCDLPTEGLTAYRRRTDSTAERLLRLGIEQLDTQPLRVVAEEMLATSSGASAAIALAELAMSQGDTVEARRWLLRGTKLASGPEGEPAGVAIARVDPSVSAAELAEAWRNAVRPGVVAASAEPSLVAKTLALLATCAVRDGDVRRAEGVLRLLDALLPEAEGRIAGKQQRLTPQLNRSIADLKVSPFNRPATSEEVAEPLVAWSWAHEFEAMQRARQALLAQRNRQRNFQLQQQRFIQVWNRHPMASARTVPSVGKDRVLWVESGKLQSLDRATGESLELPMPSDWTSLMSPQQGQASGAQDRWRVDGGLVIREGRIRVLNNRGRLTDLPLPVVSWLRAPQMINDVVYGRISRRVIEVQSVNRRRSVIEESIVGVDLASEGKLVFDLPSTEIAGDEAWTFVSQPVIEDDRVYAFAAPRTNRGALSIVCYARSPQRRLWTTPVGAGNASNVNVDPISLQRRGDALFCCTGSGALVALDWRTGRLRWVTRYPGTPTTPKVGPKPRQLAVRSGLVIAAPADSDRLLAVDGSTGAVLWSAPRDARSELVHSDAGSVVLAGEKIEWRDPLTGRSLRRFPDSPHSGIRGMGRAAVIGNELFWPTRNSVRVVDLETGLFSRPEIPLRGFVGDGADTYAAGENLLVVGAVTMALRGAESMPAEPTLGQMRPIHRVDPLLASSTR